MKTFLHIIAVLLTCFCVAGCLLWIFTIFTENVLILTNLSDVVMEKTVYAPGEPMRGTLTYCKLTPIRGTIVWEGRRPLKDPLAEGCHSRLIDVYGKTAQLKFQQNPLHIKTYLITTTPFTVK